MELNKYPKYYSICKIWNRSEETMENVLPLTDLNELESNDTQTIFEKNINNVLADLDLIIEVAHADVIKRYAKQILKYCDLFVNIFFMLILIESFGFFFFYFNLILIFCILTRKLYF